MTSVRVLSRTTKFSRSFFDGKKLLLLLVKKLLFKVVIIVNLLRKLKVRAPVLYFILSTKWRVEGCFA